MNVYICTDHDSVYPTGVASVIVAKDMRAAESLLDAALAAKGLKPRAQQSYTLYPLDTDAPGAHILQDGDY